MKTPRTIALRFHELWLAAHPFEASSYGISGYDDLVPDDSEAADAAWRSTVQGVLSEARELDPIQGSGADAVTRGCLIALAEQELAVLDRAEVEHTVTAMPYRGPAVLFSVAARTVISDASAAADYLTRLRRSGEWIDQQSERLRIGASKGRLPVAPLVEQAIKWGDAVLAQPVPSALAVPRPPSDWGGGAEWCETRDELAAEVVRPALGRWVERLRAMAANARPSDRPGLVYLPGGEADYARAVRSHTTLTLSPDELHQRGLVEIAALEDRLVTLGRELGLHGLEAVQEALRSSAGTRDLRDCISASIEAIRRAEARAPTVFPPPLPPPCAVTPMPTVVGTSGAAPHYTPPRLDGSRPGTYWFNVDRPTAGTGWDLESVAFHEAVPGHHLQLSRLQQLSDLPRLQRERHLTVFAEGWGLYAEQLAAEVGLYSGTQALLGSCTASLLRAGRLVLDTGLHAFGWTRAQALDFFRAHVPLPVGFLSTEVDRYIVNPGQALAYMVGKLEILRLREEAQRRQGTAFSLPDFHAALLDNGSLPMPILRAQFESWFDA